MGLCEDTDEKGERHVKMGAEAGVIHLQTSEPQGLPEAEETRKDPSLEGLDDTMAQPTS